MLNQIVDGPGRAGQTENLETLVTIISPLTKKPGSSGPSRDLTYNNDNIIKKKNMVGVSTHRFDMQKILYHIT
jgi:hypothetical protein